MEETVDRKPFFGPGTGAWSSVMRIRMRFSIYNLQRVQCVCIDEHGFPKTEHLERRDAKHEMRGVVTWQKRSSPPTLQI
jgi:hypothetical protein